MNALALLLLLLSPCLGPCAVNGADLPHWPALRLVNGKEYHDAKVTVVEAGGIKIMHAAGVSRVPETLLPPDIRALFTFNPGRAVVEEQERRAEDQAARERTAAIMKAQRAREAAAVLESMDWKYKVVKVGRVLGNGAYICYPHTQGGVVGEVALAVQRMLDDPRRGRFSTQPTYLEESTKWDTPMYIDCVPGAHAEGDVLRGYAGRVGVKEIGGRTLPYWISKPDGVDAKKRR